MSILGVTASQASPAAALQRKKQVGNDLYQQLGASLKHGDLSGARKAFAAINRQIQQAERARSGNHSGTTSAAATSGRNDFAALSQALKSGNLASAQQAFSSLTRDLLSYAGQDQGRVSSGRTPASFNPDQGLNGGSLHVMA